MKISPRSLIAPLISLENRKLLAARARLAAFDRTVTLSSSELELLADISDGQDNRGRGKPGTPEVIARSRALEVAAAVARLEFGLKLKRTAAVKKFAKDSKCGPRSVWGAVAVAESHQSGTWWPEVCRLAKKGKHWLRPVLFAVLERRADGWHVMFDGEEVAVARFSEGKGHKEAIRLAEFVGERPRILTNRNRQVAWPTALWFWV